jgi:DNA polymerase-3 subunit delta'
MFERVFGHHRVKNILSRMVARDCLHHGLLFHGPNGIGKRLLAREVARAMLCKQRSGCGDCAHCHKMDSGNHPDFVEIHPEGNDIKVHQVRELSENLHFRPFEGAVRVIVLDQVERLREESANAFLKSLEEPPDYVYFILVTADHKALLPTIRSRCQQIPFQSLSTADKALILVNRFGKNDEMAERLACISFRQLETEDDAWQTFKNDVHTVLTFYHMMIEAGHAIDFLSETVRDKVAYPRFYDHLAATTRELSLLALGFPGQPIFAEFAEAMKKLATAREASCWRETWAQITWLNGQRRRNLNASLWYNALGVSGLGLIAEAEHKLKQRLAARA